ncbi:MAG: nitroreductase family deazaflavin-dependent oxidoreductase [Actinomycetota bacterium]|nr:nitroreductase family deazaflavin-dependent oxidoreductase [Actinomycetota bacterium]
MAARSGDARQVRTLRMRRIDHIGDTLFRGLARLGIGPAWSLTTRGRRTGRLRTVPVIPVHSGGRQWLVSPYGKVGWVLNARAAGQVQLRRGRSTRICQVREVAPAEAGPVLKRYLRIASATRPYFTASVDAPVAAFVAEAHRHPVFALTPIEQRTRQASKGGGC